MEQKKYPQKMRNLQRKLEFDSADSLFNRFNILLEEENYISSFFCSRKMKSFEGKKDLGEIYEKLVVCLNPLNFEKNNNEKLLDEDIINNVFYAIVESTRLYADNEISKKELFLVEKLIDRIPYYNLTIKNWNEFEKFYYKFKEYCVDVFLKMGED